MKPVYQGRLPGSGQSVVLKDDRAFSGQHSMMRERVLDRDV
jgi:hypothetical protein